MAPQWIHNVSRMNLLLIMTNLSIKDVPENLADALRRRAARNHRSMQGELMAILESAIAAETSAAPWAEARAAALRDRPRAQPLRRGTKSIEEIALELRSRRSVPVNSGPSSIELIREDRDSR